MSFSTEVGKDKSCIVFIGNLPFDASEHEICEVFRKVGPVVAVKILQDKETNRSRGNALCEYRDSATADSAVRNLNQQSFRDRPLRVSRADRQNERFVEKSTIGSAVADPRDLATPDKVTSVLLDMTPEQMIAVISEFKQLQMSHPKAAEDLLHESPQLALALLEIQFLFGLLKPEALRTLMPSTKPQQIQPQPTAPISHHMHPSSHHHPPPHHPAQPPSMHSYPPSFQPHNQYNHPPGHYAPPPSNPAYPHNPGYNGPPPHAGPALSVEERKLLDMLANLPDKERKIFQVALNLSPEQLETASRANPKIHSVVTMIKALMAKGVNVPL